MSTPVTPNDFSEIRWRGHWIWTEAPAMPTSPFAGMGSAEERAEAHGLFRKRFVLEQVPERLADLPLSDKRKAKVLELAHRLDEEASQGGELIVLGAILEEFRLVSENAYHEIGKPLFLHFVRKRRR